MVEDAERIWDEGLADSRTDLIAKLLATLHGALLYPDQRWAGEQMTALDTGIARAWLVTFVAWANQYKGQSLVVDPKPPELETFRYVLADTRVRRLLQEMLSPEENDPGKAVWSELHWGPELRLHALGTTSFVIVLQRFANNEAEPVALKVLHMRFADRHPVRTAAREFACTQQARQGASSSRAACRVYASTDRWVAMEFIEGWTVRDWLQRWKEARGLTPKLSRIPWLRANTAWGPIVNVLEYLGCPLAEALASFHQTTGCYHGDLMPGNVILQGAGLESVPVADRDERYSPLTSELRVRFIDWGSNFIIGRMVETEDPDSEFRPPKGEEMSMEADAYSFGKLLRALAVPNDPSGAVIPLPVYAEFPLLGRLLEDVLDPDPRRRLVLVEKRLSSEVATANLPAALIEVVRTETLFGKDRLRWQDMVRRVGRLLLDLVFLALRGRAKPPNGDSSSEFSLRARVIRLAVAASVSALAMFVGVAMTVGGLLQDFAVRYRWPTSILGLSNIFSLGVFRGAGARPIGRIAAYAPAHLAGVSFVVAGFLYYQVIFSLLGPLGLRAAGLRAPRKALILRLVGAVIRSWTLITVALVAIGNLFEPRWWLGLACLGVGLLAMSNSVCWRFERSVWREVRELENGRHGKGLYATDSQAYIIVGADFFQNWCRTSIGYFLALLLLFVLQQLGKLHDVAVYVAVIVGVNLVVLVWNAVLSLGSTVRGRLARAFALEEHLALAAQRLGDEYSERR